MKKIGTLYRENIIETMQKQKTDANACVFVSFTKMKAFPFNVLRNDLRQLNSRFFVAKKTLICRAFQDLAKNGDSQMLDTIEAIVFIHDDDVVKTCKKLVDFASDNEGALDIKGGCLKEEVIEKEKIIALAKLPSREVLLGMAVSTIAAPLSGFVSSMNQVIVKFLWAVNEVKKKKESS